MTQQNQYMGMAREAMYESGNLYRCCNTCKHQDLNNLFGCTKANKCYNGFSAYEPNEAMKNFEKKLKEHLL